MKLAPSCLDRLGRIIERLGSSFEDLLSVRPIGVVEREKSQLLVVSHVDFFCLATERRLEWIPVYYLPENVDCESIVRLDGLLDPLLSANRSDANRLIRTIREAEEKGMPLIARRRHPDGTYSITVEDLAYLMQRDESTIHTKLGTKHQKQGQNAQSDQNNAIHSVAEEKETDQPSAESSAKISEESDATVNPHDSCATVASAAEEAVTVEIPLVASPYPPSPVEISAQPMGETAGPRLNSPTPQTDDGVLQPLDPSPVVKHTPTEKRTRRRVVDERQTLLFPLSDLHRIEGGINK